MGLPIRKSLSLFALVICAALASTPSFAQGGSDGASDETILELMKISKVDNILKQITGQVKRQIITAIRKKSPRVSERHLTEVGNVFETVYGEYFRAIMPRAIEVYRKMLTESEVRALIDFYKTPAGQSIVDKMPGLTTEIARLSMALAQDLARDAARAMVGRLREKGYDL